MPTLKLHQNYTKITPQLGEGDVYKVQSGLVLCVLFQHIYTMRILQVTTVACSRAMPHDGWSVFLGR